jgi:predicted RND superfamily exporter protein
MIVLPFAVGIRAISHTVQITSRFIEEYARCENKTQAAHITAGAMFIPNVSAIAAECAGFIFLVAVKITVVQQIAVAITFWLFAIFFTSAILTPIICVLLPKPSEKVTEAIKKSWGNIAVNGKGGDKLDKIIFVLTRFFMTKGRPIAIVGMVVVIVTGAYLAKDLHSGDLSPGSPVLYPNSEYNIASAEINERFEHAGTDVLQVYFDGKGKSGMAFAPAVLQAQERLHKEFLKKLPDTYSGWDSVVPIVKKMNVEMHEGDTKWDFVPDDPQLLGTVLSIYLAKLLPTDFNKYVDAETRSLGNVNYFFKDHMPNTIKDAMKVTSEFFEKLDIDVSPFGEFRIAGGEIGVGYAINNEIDSVHYLIIFGVLFLIFLLCALSFKSATAGLLLIVPVVSSNAIAFGYMVFQGIGMTINTLPVICVGLGIGVDFGIYLYTRFQEIGRAHV